MDTNSSPTFPAEISRPQPDEQLVLELRALASRTLAARRTAEGPALDARELFSIDPLTTAPLPEATLDRPRAPRWPLAAALALVALLMGSTSSWAVLGFNKRLEGNRLVDPSIAGDAELDPPKPLGVVFGFAQERREEAPLVEARPVTPDPRAPARPALPARRPASVGQREQPPATPQPRVGSPDAQGRREEPASAGLDRSLAALVDGAVDGASAPLQPSRPAGPTRAQVLTGMRGVAGAVSRCGLGRSGQVSVDATLDGSTGRVTASRVSGAASDAEAACIQRALLGASFPTFADEGFQVTNFPFTLR